MRILLVLLLIPFPAHALDVAIEDYVPPPMFGEPVTWEEPIPLPPKRPTKFQVPQSFVQEFLIEKSITDPLERKLTRPDVHEILDQIDPQ